MFLKEKGFNALKEKFFGVGIWAGIVLVMSGCAPYGYSPGYVSPSYSNQSVYQQTEYKVTPDKATYTDKIFDVELTPLKEDEHYRGFTVTIKNKTNNDLKLVWNDTYFLENDSARGGFMFEGVVYSKRTEPKQDLLILPNSSSSLDIFPNDKVMYITPDQTAMSMGLPSGWVHAVMKDGTFGAYLMITGKGFEKRVKLVVGIQKI